MPESMGGIQRAVQAIISRAKEILTQPLYDSSDIAAATVGNVQFFTVNTIGNVGLLRTNMELAGQLPAPRQLLIQQVSVIPWASQAVAAASVSVADDVALIAAQTTITLTVSDKPYLRGPSLLFPGGVGIETADVTQGHSGLASPMARFNMMRPGQLLKPNENFNVVLNIPVAIAGLTQSTRVYVVLWGLQLRSVQ
jgi:hypothetical protein